MLLFLYSLPYEPNCSQIEIIMNRSKLIVDMRQLGLRLITMIMIAFLVQIFGSKAGKGSELNECFSPSVQYFLLPILWSIVLYCEISSIRIVLSD